MEAVVGYRFLGPLAPLHVGLDEILLRIRNRKVDDHGRAARKAGRGARVEILGRHRSHERQLHMGVWVDTAGHDVLATCVDDRRAARCFDVFSDGGDDTICAEYVCSQAAIGVDDRAALDKNCHDESPFLATR